MEKRPRNHQRFFRFVFPLSRDIEAVKRMAKSDLHALAFLQFEREMKTMAGRQVGGVSEVLLSSP